MTVEELIARLADLPPYYEVRLNVTGSPAEPRRVHLRTAKDGPWVEVTT